MDFFKRQIPLIGEDCQKTLKNSVALVAGLGGLGSLVSQLLVRMGIGKLYIVDYDKVQASNLHRQLLYNADDIKKFKVDVAFKSLKDIKMETEIISVNNKIDKFFQVPKDVDIVVDCLDNLESKVTLSNLCKNKYFVHAGVQGYVGQVLSLKGNSLDDVMKFSKDVKKPVIPTLVSLTASIQANEAVNLLCSKQSLLNKILFIDILNYDFSIVGVKNV